MTREWFSAKELALKLTVTKRSIERRAKDQAWQSRPRTGKGGGKEYHISSLPMETQVALMKQSAEAEANTESETEALVPEILSTPSVPTVQTITSYNSVKSSAEKSQPNIPPAKIFDKAMAKAGLLQAYLDHLKKAPRGTKAQAREDFANTYNTGLLYPETFAKLGKTSWKSIERWKKTIATTGDALNLADMRGHLLKGRTIINHEQAAIILGCVLSPNKPKISYAIRQAKMIMAARGIENGFAESTYRRWLEEWKSNPKYYPTWVQMREGDKALNDKVSYNLERDYSKIKVGSILVADGHTLNFETLNPWTGKPKRMTLILFYDMASSMPLGWEIMPTEDTQAISSALRRAIIALGKFPEVVYLDNGRAFKSKFFNGCEWDDQAFTGVYAQLGIRTIFARPYHGQSKTVERFFGTFAELEMMMPTYVGTSIENKPPRMHRGEKLHRQLWDKATGGACPTLVQTHQAISDWFDVYARRPQRGHLAGRAPLDLFDAGRGPGIDKVQLSLLMMAHDIRKVAQDGIRFHGQNYYHPELYGMTTAVTIRYDLVNRNSILVYDEKGQYLCEASLKEKVHPAAWALGDEADQKLLSEQLELKNSLDKQARGPARKLLEAEILPAIDFQMKALGLAGGAQDLGSQKDESTPALSGVNQAEQLEQDLAELHEFNKPEATDIFNEIERLDGDEKYEKLLEVEVRGLLMPSEHKAWMRYFEQTPAYSKNLDHYESLRGQLAVAWQCEAIAEV